MTFSEREKCDRCRALGWIKRPGREWAEACTLCLGTTKLPTVYRLAEMIDENRTTLYRVRDMAGMRTDTALRVLGKLSRLAKANGVVL